MTNDVFILVTEAMIVYLLVLWAHAWRTRVGLAYFYALLGGLTAVMSWVTDAGVTVEFGGVTFMVGSTVFYTSLLLGVFVVYVFDGPRATRIAITTIAGVSIMVPIIAFVLHLQLNLTGAEHVGYVPIPSLRINTASLLTTIADLVFLAIAWEFLGRAGKYMNLWLRAFLTLLGVMWLDVLLFNTGAFLGTDDYFNIMKGTFVSRLVICVFASPLLYTYLRWQHGKSNVVIEKRPVLAILKEMTQVRAELVSAQKEIQRRKRVEQKNRELIARLEKTLAHVSRLEGLLPICSHCKRIRLSDMGGEGENGEQIEAEWISLEKYVGEKTAVKLSHGICKDCLHELYPEMADEVLRPPPPPP